jgi:hypothetical protein
MHAQYFYSLPLSSGRKGSSPASLGLGMSSRNSNQDNGSKQVEESKREAGRVCASDPLSQQSALERERQARLQQGLVNPAADWQLRPLSAFTAAAVHAQARRTEDNVLLAIAAGSHHGSSACINLAAGMGQSQRAAAQALIGSPDDPRMYRSLLLSSSSSSGQFSALTNDGNSARQGNSPYSHDLQTVLFAARVRQMHLQSQASCANLSYGLSGSMSGLSGTNALYRQTAGLASLGGTSNPLGSLIPTSTAFSASGTSHAQGALSSSSDPRFRTARLMALPSATSTQTAAQQQQVDSRRLMEHLGTAPSQWQQQGSIGNDKGVHQQDLTAPAPSASQQSSVTIKSRSRKRSTAPSSFHEPPSKRSKSCSTNRDPGERGRCPPAQETTLALAGKLPPALPPAEIGIQTPHYSQRSFASLATNEDHNWLSELQCFIRQEILEVFRATSEDVRVRNNSKHLETQQVGIRCRFCAHLPPSGRASRSSAFPSSVLQIYQSFTMMLRDHWPACQSIPSPQKERFSEFKAKNNQGKCELVFQHQCLL